MATDGGQIQGLGDIPASWPDLPDNASLAVEVGWVQAQRLRIVTAQASGATVVHLDRAGAPAPSWAALGWIETSMPAPVGIGSLLVYDPMTGGYREDI